MIYAPGTAPEDMPAKMARLPRQKGTGYPIPWFVAEVDGKPDFRIADQAKFRRAFKERRCWVCGGLLVGVGAFVIGPMCAVNRTSSEPPAHPACARYSARACPFLITPGRVRRETHLPEERVEPAGMAIQRNPGVALVWLSSTWKPWRAPGGTLVDIGEPAGVEWFREGRLATRAEVLESIDSGLQALGKMAEAEGPDAVVALSAKVNQAMRLLPKE